MGESALARPSQPVNGKRILVADHNRLHTACIARQFALWGAKVTSAANTAEAEKALSQDNYDIALLDLGLQEGHEIITELKNSHVKRHSSKERTARYFNIKLG